MDLKDLSKQYENVKEYSLTRHLLGVSAVCISKKCWDSLTDEERTIIQEEFDKAAVNNNKNLVELDKELVKNLEDAGVKINEVNLPEFAKLVEKVK